MKRHVFIAGLLLLLMAQSAMAQDTLHWQALHQNFMETNRQSMLVLGTWSVANIGLGLWGNQRFEGVPKYTYQMHAIWNVVNPGIASYGYFHHAAAASDVWQTIADQESMHRIFLFNAGLDVAYMAGGLWMRQKGLTTDGVKGQRLRGYGQAIIIQGAFLFLFDLTMSFIDQQHNEKLYEVLRHFK